MKIWKSDRGLEARMMLTMALLAMPFIWCFLVFCCPWASVRLIVSHYSWAASCFSSISFRQDGPSSMGAKIVSENEEPRLHDIVRRLCQNADLPMPKIAVVRTGMPNAFATGRNKNNAVVAVTTGLRVG